MKYVCEVCGWEYDEELGFPENGIEPGTKFEDLPDDFLALFVVWVKIVLLKHKLQNKKFIKQNARLNPAFCFFILNYFFSAYSFAASRKLTNTSPCWVGFIVPGSMLR